MFPSRIVTALALSCALLATGANAETHTVTFTNNCRYGTPLLKANGKTLSTGNSVTINGPLVAAIAFLQTGKCGDNGEGCTLVETTLQNPTTPGSGSSTDISLITPHAFSVPSGFKYHGSGCDNLGTNCASASCPKAFREPDDTTVQVACQGANANLEITFC